MLGMLEQADLEDMAVNGPFPIEIRCHHCNAVYAFNQSEIKRLLDQRIIR
jgi:molecular chaperone Hsp33